MSLLEKFSNYLPDVLDENQCWEWKGHINQKPSGYGQITIVNNKTF
jgi:hypothetical protein